MNRIRQDRVTVIAYRASRAITSLGHLEELHESELEITYYFELSDREALMEYLVDTIAMDVRLGRRDRSRPEFMFIFLIAGVPITGDKIIDYEQLVSNARAAATKIVDGEEVAAKEREAQLHAAHEENARAKDRAEFRRLVAKYGLAGLQYEFS